MLYPPFGRIDFYFSVSSQVKILGDLLSLTCCKTRGALLKTSTCTSCLAASVPRHTSSNTGKSELYEYIFYPPRLSPAILSHTVSLQNQLLLLYSPEKQQQTKSVCKWLFLIYVFIWEQCWILWVCDCVCSCILYVCAVLIATGTQGNKDGSV